MLIQWEIHKQGLLEDYRYERFLKVGKIWTKYLRMYNILP